MRQRTPPCEMHSLTFHSTFASHIMELASDELWVECGSCSIPRRIGDYQRLRVCFCVCARAHVRFLPLPNLAHRFLRQSWRHFDFTNASFQHIEYAILVHQGLATLQRWTVVIDVHKVDETSLGCADSTEDRNTRWQLGADGLNAAASLLQQGHVRLGSTIVPDQNPVDLSVFVITDLGPCFCHHWKHIDTARSLDTTRSGVRLHGSGNNWDCRHGCTV
mmetsp:Transcript_20354/g.56668  ORF Transcript_20354/g.56668 Transcript_20354/m.56668 type:complete len:219 (-) Transcript_20354:204-860(-)